jgi:hypothetical protein
MDEQTKTIEDVKQGIREVVTNRGFTRDLAPRQDGEAKAATFKQVHQGFQELTKRLDGTKQKAEQLRKILCGPSNEIDTPQPKPGVNMPVFDQLAYELVLVERMRAIIDHQLTTALEAVR